MFQVGDKIFYPMHGAGIIEAMEEKEFLGEKHLYFVLHMLLKELDIMVPVEKMSALGIRSIVDGQTLEQVFAAFHEREPDLSVNSAQRLKMNTEKLKSGDIYEGAEVIRDLQFISRNKVLGTSDRIMLDNAMLNLISEIELVRELDREEATELLRRIISEEAVNVAP
ncbi:CarD family transcriptional regulator [Brevibacillus choshinensis]|uniref:CarD family transcriptional regulator n=1 Tax=Brevibacillus choshinensis TaxID=54911 RepID=A0ABR5NBH2_BRECH|nr:CarD family transcriptional regulator [Brevibacillus choshinensis]KQL48889.1 CarD family transcriptional regulator [Brevibacillus choshinensis]